MGLHSGFDVSRASWEFPEGTCAGYNGYPSDLENNGQETDKNKNAASADSAEETGSDRATKISFSAAGLGGNRTNWEAVMWQERLYVSVTSNQLAEGSKRAFVSLLEYAEEELEVTHVVACLDRLHHDNKNVIRNFLSPSSTWSLQRPTSWQGCPMLSQEILCLHRTHPAGKGQWGICLRRNPSLQGVHCQAEDGQGSQKDP